MYDYYRLSYLGHGCFVLEAVAGSKQRLLAVSTTIDQNGDSLHMPDSVNRQQSRVQLHMSLYHGLTGTCDN